MRFPSSIRFRVTAVATLTTAVVVAGFGWLLLEFVAGRLVSDGEEQLATLAEGVEGLALVQLGEGGAEYRLDDEDITLILDLDDDGDVTVELLPGDDVDDEPIGEFVLDSGTGEIRGIDRFDEEFELDEIEALSRQAAEVVLDRAGEVDGGRLDLISSTEAVLGRVSDGVGAARSGLLLVGPFLVLASGLITWLVVGRALAPTRRIATEAAAIGSDNLDQRLSRDRSSAEVDTIARVINEMLDRIEGGLRREQQFVADASHELRTPLTTARMAAELAAADAPDSPYPTQLVEEIDRMRALVEDLLQLARDPAPAVGETVPLDALVGDVVVAHPASDRIELTLGDPVSVHGRPAEIRRVVVNLLDNAAHYGERAVVELTSDGRMARLTIDDDGPGIRPADRGRIFERFTRLDEGRARHDGGSGLGLAIVHAIVERHRGAVMVDDSPLGGARLVVELPIRT